MRLAKLLALDWGASCYTCGKALTADDEAQGDGNCLACFERFEREDEEEE